MNRFHAIDIYNAHVFRAIAEFGFPIRYFFRLIMIWLAQPFCRLKDDGIDWTFFLLKNLLINSMTFAFANKVEVNWINKQVIKQREIIEPGKVIAFGIGVQELAAVKVVLIGNGFIFLYERAQQSFA